jgi:hypothetical protein
MLAIETEVSTTLWVVVATVSILGIALLEWASARALNTLIEQDTNIAQYYTLNEGEYTIATFYKDKYRNQAAVSGHYQAAKNLRKQGVPLEVTLAILFDGNRTID